MILFKNLTKKYKDNVVINDITLDIKKGEYTALIGNNGSGKTTLINLVCNLIGTTNGDVYFSNKLISPKYVEYKKELGILLSEPYYVEEFTAKEYLRFIAKFQNIEKNKIDKRIQDLIELLDINNPDKAIKKMSSGNKMKVSIASTLIHNPSVLIYDEPFINLDINISEKIKELLLSIKNSKTLLITSHNIDLVVELCDRFIVLENGKITIDVYKNSFSSNDSLKKHIKEKIIEINPQSKLKWLN